MSLEIGDNLFKKDIYKENLEIQSQLINTIEENQKSILEKIVEEKNCTIELRDKMLLERNKILKDCANRFKNNEEMYYIYEKNSLNTYLMTKISENQDYNIIKITKDQMPQYSEVDCILKKIGEKFILDEEATEYVKIEMNERFEKILHEQNQNIKEGHIYEFVERADKSAWLIDTNEPQEENQSSYDVFEEKNFPEELLENAKEGDLFEFIHGEFKNV